MAPRPAFVAAPVASPGHPCVAARGSWTTARPHGGVVPLRSSPSACRSRLTPPTMAGGVPKVPYKAPGQQTYEFIDVFNRLYRERIVYINQDMDDETANQTIAVLLYLEQEDAVAPVQMYFNCAGGTTAAGLAVWDCMRSVKYPIATLNLGLAASISALLVAAGTPGKRSALPNARFLLQAPNLPEGVRGQASDIAVEVKEVLRQRDRFAAALNKLTGQTEEKIKEVMQRDFYLSAPEAVQFGLIDKVLSPAPPKPSKAAKYTAGIGAPSDNKYR
eukprot:contig_25184_g6211